MKIVIATESFYYTSKKINKNEICFEENEDEKSCIHSKKVCDGHTDLPGEFENHFLKEGDIKRCKSWAFFSN